MGRPLQPLIPDQEYISCLRKLLDKLTSLINQVLLSCLTGHPGTFRMFHIHLLVAPAHKGCTPTEAQSETYRSKIFLHLLTLVSSALLTDTDLAKVDFL
jgi:hypothetical protein